MFKMAKTLTSKIMAPKLLALGLGVALTGLSTTANAQVLYMAKDQNVEAATRALQVGDLETASAHFRRAASFDIGKDRLLPVLNNLCAVDYALGKLDSAAEACDRAIQEDRHFWRAYVNRGNVRKAQGDYEGARADYQRAVSLSPKEDLPKQALASLDNGSEKLVAGIQ